ncbi:hypothetical protein BLA29_003119 [Euroglyphus maynei]|uniref:Integrase catalytic domain-containing protein n=1 Tax=Euroglyphus maynei TaxID=6958 RepID=A0A1Y3BKG2_EURMA|nr:hypothetical protein BLA29_003119 [Euroglyphus maynei]
MWQNFALFKDEDGILRIRTRIGNNPMFTFTEINPILLEGHLSIQRMHVEIRQKYWITKKSRIIKKLVNSCKVCRILKAKQYDAPAGDLPISRITQGIPYETIGMDHFGPIQIKITDFNGKIYVLLIICLKTLNVSLKVVKSLTTEENWNVIRRFMNDFGYPSLVLSDNSKTFVALGKMYNRYSIDKKDNEHIAVKWHHITAYSPFRGGLWERAVRTVKETMKAMSFSKSYKFEEFVSLMSDVQYIVNSRPVAIEEGLPITPLMMFRGGKINETTDMNETWMVSDNKDLNNIWKQRNANLKILWNIWINKLFLHNPTYVYTKNGKKSVEPKVGDLVLLKNPSKTIGEYQLGRIIELIKGSDGIVRTVTVKTGVGIARRSIQTLLKINVE